MRFVVWRALSGGHPQAVECHSPWTLDAENPHPITISDIEIADASLRATIKAEVIAALAFIPRARRVNFSAGSGVLSNGTGQVRVSWDAAREADQRRLHLTWQEAGGPPVKEPRHRGFGSLLIQSWRCRHPDRVSPGRPKVSSRPVLLASAHVPSCATGQGSSSARSGRLASALRPIPGMTAMDLRIFGSARPGGTFISP